MATTYKTPGVYIEEVTGPGVIAGVGTSTAAFIGPAVAGPLDEPRRVSSFDEYLTLFGTLADGTIAPYITFPRRFYLSHAVRGFFENGGAQAYVLRVGTAKHAKWNVTNQAAPPEVVFVVQAVAAGTFGNGLTVATSDSSLTGDKGVALATATTKVTDIKTETLITVENAKPFQVGDVVTVNQAAMAMLAGIDYPRKELTLQAPLAGLKKDDTLTLADVAPATAAVRLNTLTDAQKLFPGSVVHIKGKNPENADKENYALVQAVNRSSGVVTLSPSLLRTNTFRPAAAPNETVLISKEFTLSITPAGVSFPNLSLSPSHPRYVLRAVNSGLVKILPPPGPPTTAAYPDALVKVEANWNRTVNGADDAPASLGPDDYGKALERLKDVQDVNIVCIPDAASLRDPQHPEQKFSKEFMLMVQEALRDHCVAQKDRVAVLDSWPEAPPSGQEGVDVQRRSLESDRGFAALYYPWLTVRDPSSPSNDPSTINIPPCGHIAGVYARTDAERGVHKAPANTGVRGVLGLERLLSDRQQGPLNDEGVNVLRIFPGSGTVTVWGARTTVRKDVTDWRYVSTRRLLIYIEQSLEEGLRSAVFEPNNPSLWARLTRQIDEFLTRVWRDGALFGEKATQAFYVRIDAALNPPSTQALGQLHIEIGVRPSYPAEFIIVRIGLWDGGAQISEQ